MSVFSVSSVSKAFKILPKLIDLIADIEAKVAEAKADGKVTPVEIAKIVASEIGPLVDAIVAIVV